MDKVVCAPWKVRGTNRGKLPLDARCGTAEPANGRPRQEDSCEHQPNDKDVLLPFGAPRKVAD
jgi:hypothetical protein